MTQPTQESGLLDQVLIKIWQESKLLLISASVIFSLLFVTLYWPTIKWMIWRFDMKDSYSTHGYIIPFVSLYLIWTIKPLFHEIKINASWQGLWLAIPSLLLHLLAGLADVSSISAFTMIPLIAGFLWCFFGFQWVKTAWFPLIFLLFTIPLPDFVISGLNFKLKFWASDLAAAGLTLFGLPTVREGSFLLFDENVLAVGDVCSGLRSLLSLIALGIFYSWLIRDKGKINVWVTILTIIPAAVIGNGLRIGLVSLLVYFFGNEFVFEPRFAGQDIHLLTGFFIFATALGCLWLSNFVCDSLGFSNSREKER